MYRINYNLNFRIVTFLTDDSARRDKSPRLTSKYVADVSSLWFMRQVGIVSDGQTRFIARYVPRLRRRSWSLVTSVPSTSRNCQQQSYHVYCTLHIKYVAESSLIEFLLEIEIISHKHHVTCNKRIEYTNMPLRFPRQLKIIKSATNRLCFFATCGRASFELNSQTLIGVGLKAVIARCVYSVDLNFCVSDNFWINLHTLDFVRYISIALVAISVLRRCTGNCTYSLIFLFCYYFRWS